MSHPSPTAEEAPPPTSATEPTATQLSLCCSVCQEGPFGSRNQLFTHLRTKHYADDALFPSVSPLEALYQSGAERTAASVAARGTYENSVHDRYYRAQQQASILIDVGVIGDNKNINHTNNGNRNTNGTASWTTADWDEAKAFFQKPLPVAFRTLLPTNNNNNNKSSVTEETFSSIPPAPREEVDVRYYFLHRLHQLTPKDALQPCEAVPSQLALKATQPPRQWSPEAQRCLMDAQDVGAVSRQEVCSMIPPLLLLLPLPSENNNNNNNNKNQASLLLDNNHAGTGLSVLDLCSAPGSKSLQLLDMMHYMAMNTTRDTTSSSGDDKSGNSNNFMLVCNDANRLRLLTVARRSRRQPAHYRPSCLLNSSDGRYFPSLCKWGGYKFKFSRVLADVPCSGDGTLRKLSRREWQKWNVRSHLQLHPLQIRLLTRALECVQKGGRVVYSTCSLDPIEDEAVVVSAIARMVGGPHSYRIVPMPITLSFPPMAAENNKSNNTDTKSFPHSKGATRWIVPHPEFGQDVKVGKKKAAADDAETEKEEEKQATITYDTYTSIDQVPVKLRRRDISPSMFPPHARTEDLFRKAYEEQQESLKLALQEKAKRSETINKEKSSDNKDNKKESQKEKIPMSVDEKVQQAKRWGEILSPEDIEAFKTMLPNCARIFPQHLDSGGFFCAVIERVAPTYFAVCYPRHREALEGKEGNNKTDTIMQLGSCEPQPDYKYHGRILYPVESAKQVRDLIAKDKGKGEDVVFEGLATRELAIQWLKKHKCYTEKTSDETIQLTATTEANDGEEMAVEAEEKELTRKSREGGGITGDNKQENDENDLPTKRVKRQVNDPTKSAIYTPLFAPPHPSLVAELCDFFGLHTDPEQARKALVDVFPSERLVVWIGSGEEEAATVTTCLDPEEAHKLVRREDMEDAKEKIARKRRFLQLTLVSDEIMTLYKGGAKFSPMEVGLVLCWVPVPGLYRESYDNESSKKKKRKQKGGESDSCVDSNGVKEVVRFEDSTARAVKSGRYGVLDEAAEFLGRTATKRLVALTRSEALQLLSLSSLDVGPIESSASQAQSSTVNGINEDAWWWESKWGKQRLPDLQGWGAGAVIAVVLCGQINSSSAEGYQSQNRNTGSSYSNIYLPCVLRQSFSNEESSMWLELLAEQRLTDAYKRLLGCTATMERHLQHFHKI